MNLYQVLQSPLISEKSQEQTTRRKDHFSYTFRVHPMANKELVRQALRYFYKVTAVKVNIWNMPSKKRRFQRHDSIKPAYKKAVVLLKRGESMEFTSREK